ncbi:MAG TPA: C25 family peptidase propeptide domain-containing protein, partial [Candidatus Syntrophosphaera sp.]|nr:C25 family peptidase propeptide domain-containing protein [Candidatus Syntrophosphaera sp.]
MHQEFKGKVLLLIALTLAFALALSAQTRQLDLSSSANQAVLKNNSDLGFDVNFSVGELKITEVQTKEGTFDELSIEGWGFSNAVGEPKLPLLRRTIAVPLGAEVRLTLNSQSARELDATANKLQNRIIPAQEPVSKSADPATLPFIIKSDLYGRDEFNSRDWVQVSDLGIMRGVRVFALDFYPVRYNPASNSIRVMENLDVRVDFVNPDLLGTADLLAKTGSHEFDSLYAKTIFNWMSDDRTSIVRYPTRYLILCPPNYTDELQPFVDWKIQQGYAVTVTTVGTGGTIANSTTAIKNYMTSVWSAATT